MNKSRDSSKEMPGSSSAMTGRDGAVDFAAKASAAAVSEQEQTDRFCRIYRQRCARALGRPPAGCPGTII